MCAIKSVLPNGHFKSYRMAGHTDLRHKLRPIAEMKTAIGFALLFVAAITPTLLVPIPAMEDYLDHLGRMYVLAAASTTNANPYYQISWGLYPDLAMDLIVPQLARFMDVETAGKIFFLAAQLIVVTGAIALEWAVKGRHQISSFAALLTLYSLPFSLGLVNFEFGTGIALFGIAAWIALSRMGKWRMRVGIHMIFSSALFLAHFFALGIYGLAIGLFELRRVIESRFDIRRTLTIIVTLAFPVVLILLLMLSTGASVGESDNDWQFTWKPIWFVLFLNGYNVALAAGSACALAALLVYGAIKRIWFLTIDGRWIALGLFVVFILMPAKLFGSRMADIRMISASLLILPAFTVFVPQPKSFAHFARAAIILMILTNSAYVGYVWASYQADYKAMKASFALLRQDSFILVGSSPGRGDFSTILMEAPLWRAPTLAVYYSKAFVSSLYTIPGTHAVDVAPKWRHLAINSRTETYAPPSLATLKAIAEGQSVPGAPQYIHNWQNDFDYLYLLGPHVPNLCLTTLVEIATDRRFTVYRIQRTINSATHN
jgi:hypothetical protein